MTCTHYLIIRDENGGSVVTEEEGYDSFHEPVRRGLRSLFPVVEFHTIEDAGRGTDTYRLVKPDGSLSHLVHITEDENN